MRDTAANLQAIQDAGYRLLGNFRLPEAAWWDEYYRPLEHRIAALESRLPGDQAARAVAEMERREIALYRKYADYYGYEFYVMRLES